MSRNGDTKYLHEEPSHPSPSAVGITGGSGSVTLRLTVPNNWDDFEAFSYRLLYDENAGASINRYGRNGQGQNGIDIHVRPIAGSRYGVQCKHEENLNKAKLTKLRKKVHGWVKAADDGGLSLSKLVIYVSCGADKRLVDLADEISEQRQRDGRFPIAIETWSELSTRARSHPRTLALLGLAPIHQQPPSLEKTVEAALKSALRSVGVGTLVSATSDSSPTVPDEHLDTLNRVVAQQLDRAKDGINSGNIARAREILEDLREGFDSYDNACRSRWLSYLGSCEWAKGNHREGATHYLEAFELDDKLPNAWANRIRATCILESSEAAIPLAEEALQRFADSEVVWSVYLQVCVDAKRSLPDQGSLPEAVRDTTDVLMAYAAASLANDDFEQALTYAFASMAKKPKGWGTRRILLSSALLLATRGLEAPDFSQILPEHRQHLELAVDGFAPLHDSLDKLKGQSAEHEVIHNLAAATLILGRLDDARVIIERSEALTADEQLFAVALQVLLKSKTAGQVKAFIQPRLEKLPIVATLMAFEVAVGQKDRAWAEQLLADLASSDLSDQEAAGLATLRNDYAVAFESPEHVARQLARSAETFPNSTIVATSCAEGWHAIGNRPLAIIEARRATTIAIELGHRADISHAAKTAYRLKLWEEARPLYERLLLVAGDNEITHHLLVCCLHLDARAAVEKLLNRLPTLIRAKPAFRKIEIRLRQLTQDWAALKKLLESEPDILEKEALAAINYAGTLEHLGLRSELKSFADRDPAFAGASIQEECEFAKIQMFRGTPSQAMRRMYRRARLEPESVEVASHFLILTILPNCAECLAEPELVSIDTAVTIDLENEPLTIVFEGPHFDALPRSVEVVRGDGPQSGALMGKRVGENVSIYFQGKERVGTVRAIRTVYAHQAAKAHVLLAKSLERRGPMWSVRMVNEDGQLDIDLVRSQLAERSGYVRHVFESFAKNPPPAATLAKILGVDEITLWLEWPIGQLPQRICKGSAEERANAVQAIADLKGRAVVVDLVTLVDLVRFDLISAVPKLLGRPLVASSTAESVRLTLHLEEQNRSKGVLFESDGKLGFHEVSLASQQSRLSFLKRLLSSIEMYCDVVPVVGPQELPVGLARTKDVLHDDYEIALLCLERDAVLLSEDGAFADLANEWGIKTRCWIQPLAALARDRGLISQQQLSLAVLGKIDARHSFISVGANELLALHDISSVLPSYETKRVLKYLGRPDTELMSAMQVVTDFLTPHYHNPSLEVSIALAYFYEAARAIAAIFPDGIIYTIPRLITKLVQLRLEQSDYVTNGSVIAPALMNAVLATGAKFDPIRQSLIGNSPMVRDLFLINGTAELGLLIMRETYLSRQDPSTRQNES